MTLAGLSDASGNDAQFKQMQKSGTLAKGLAWLDKHLKQLNLTWPAGEIRPTSVLDFSDSVN